jgi:intracellular sulfur oxidation DsrE/DsrF family protein
MTLLAAVERFLSVTSFREKINTVVRLKSIKALASWGNLSEVAITEWATRGIEFAWNRGVFSEECP